MPKNPRIPSERYVKLSIASWVRAYLERAGTTQAKLAEDAGLSEATISNIRSGKVLPGFKMLVGLGFGLGAYLNEAMRWPHDGVAAGTTKVAGRR